MASIAALDFVSNGITEASTTKVITFGAPRVFSTKAAQQYNNLLGQNTVRIEQKYDPITRIPPTLLGYKHVGMKIVMNADTMIVHLGKAYNNIIAKIDEHAIELAAKLKQKQANNLYSMENYANIVKNCSEKIFSTILEEVFISKRKVSLGTIRKLSRSPLPDKTPTISSTLPKVIISR